jgi:polyhydroxyalkanoate synthesis regulator phasin
VIQQWLQGVSRDKIAAENSLSSGTVTNIVDEWRSALGFSVAESLRELAVTLKKVGISPAQCAVGFRVAMIMLKVGVKEDSFESFIVDVYNRCNNLGLSPENISLYIEELLEFSKTVPFSQIPDYITKQADEKRKSENQIERLRNEIETLEEQKSDREALRDIALQDQEMTSSELKWYSDLKEELIIKYGIPVNDIATFAKTVDSIRKYGYDAGKVISEFSDLELLRVAHNHLQETVQSLGTRVNDLNKQCYSLELRASFHSQAINAYEHLQVMGFGLKELRLIRNTVVEIADANNIPDFDAIKKFYKDIQEQYDNKLGFESEVEKLRAEINGLHQQLSKLRAESSMHQLIGPILAKLFQSGVKEQDIIDAVAIFERYTAAGGGDRRSLIAQLDKYSGLKPAVQDLTQQADKLTKEVSSLQTQKQDLQIENQKMMSSLIYSSHTVDFLNGKIYSLKNEIMRLVSIAAFVIMYLLNPQFQDHWKLQLDSDTGNSVNGGSPNNYNNGDQEFAVLIKAQKGESVPIQDVKKGVAKAIEVMLSKLDNNNNNSNTNDRLIEALSNARFALMNQKNY